ncbi:MAG: hypothetical protein O2819_06195 [Planctomycetota bacterium]|nr:hypothetical protein [Planctomycetota bacterium]MDA1105165.1 hypothetical protein [Planctomycetota bacterium]
MSPVDRDELFELAQLELLGALDDPDLSRLEALRRRAPAALLAEVLDLQAALAADDDLLPDVNPDAALRSRVLAGIADAAELRRRDGLTPLASLGEVPRGELSSDRLGTQPGSLGARRTRFDNAEEAVSASLLSAARESNTDALVARWRFSAVFWRAASVALGASLLVVMLANYSLTNRVSHISELALGASTRADLVQFTGPALTQQLQGESIIRGMVAPSGNNAAGMVIKSPLAQSGLLVAIKLPKRSIYDIVVRSGADSWTIHSGYAPTDSIDSIALNFGNAVLGPGSRIEVVDRETGAVALTAEI